MDARVELRHATREDWGAVAELIHHSTNAWYEAHGKPAVFQGGPSSTLLFCEVYEALDPGCCLVAVEEKTGRIVGSCFYHARERHVSLGIMNVHPDYCGQGVARRLLAFVLEFAKREDKPVRLVSSAMNLDSYALYNRAGFAPYAVYQDMILEVPAEGISQRVPAGKRVREARREDVAAMVALEEEVLGIRRGGDWEYFIRNESGDWHVSVLEDGAGRLEGFLASIDHPASAMLGPGCMRSEEDAVALIRGELDGRRGRTMVWLVPADRSVLVKEMFALGARVCELHLGQSTGTRPEIKGVVMPTFMPETA